MEPTISPWVLGSRNSKAERIAGPASDGLSTGPTAPHSLVRCQLGLTPHEDAPGLRTLSSLPGTGPDQLALKLSQTAQDREHEPPVRCRGIRPDIPQRPEASALFGNGVEQIQEIPR